MDAAAFAARYPAARLATALSLSDGQLDVLLGGAQPEGWDAAVDQPAVDGARSRLSAALDGAESQVAAGIATRYDWPAVSAAPLIPSIVAPLAMEALYGDDIPKGARAGGDRARALIQRLAKGGRRLLDASGAPYPEAGAAVAVARPAPSFAGRDLGGYVGPAAPPGGRR